MNLNINTPEFWEQVKKNYEKSNQVFLCYASGNFNEVWQWYARRAEIIEFAREFLRGVNHFGIIQTGESFLFTPKDGQAITDEERRAVRIEFLNYMITKTQQQNAK